MSPDFGSTLLDLAVLDGHIGMQGHSLVPALDDPGAPVRDALLIEDDAPPLLAQFLQNPAKTRTAVLADGTKYTRNDKGEEQLFDLVADPDELFSLVADGRRRSRAVEALGDLLLDAADVATGQAVTVPG